MLFRRSDQTRIDSDDADGVACTLATRFREPYFATGEGNYKIRVVRIGNDGMTKKAIACLKTLGYERRD